MLQESDKEATWATSTSPAPEQRNTDLTEQSRANRIHGRKHESSVELTLSCKQEKVPKHGLPPARGRYHLHFFIQPLLAFPIIPPAGYLHPPPNQAPLARFSSQYGTNSANK